MKLAVIFGGKSTEHEVSVVSGTSVLSHLDQNKYDIYPIYISKEGLFYKYNPKSYKMLVFNEKIANITLIDNLIDYLKEMDVIFPVLHGSCGEDGTIQGLFELINVPYVGCHVLSSSLCMDKVYTKKILKNANIFVTKDMYIKKEDNNYIYIDDNFNYLKISPSDLLTKVESILGFPVFIKPSNSGSSVGVHRAEKGDFLTYLEDAFKYDNKVLIEEEIIGKEIECAVLGNNDLVVSNLGEILKDDYYDYDAKYVNSVKTKIPADITEELNEKVREIAKKAYHACDCQGLSRVDFFIENNTNKIYLNEINTLPGFTSISMYPQLMNDFGYSYSELLDELIKLAFSKN